ncbi:MAG: HAD family hydrolase [Candidatus Hydrogenedentes bacterium]|nr:HAD family hydrolase [Candidatus Hydrogenedentota bacterium]
MAELEGLADMAVRAITFDFWMTLFEEHNRAERHQVRVDEFCEATGADPVAADTAIQKAHAEFFRVHATEQRTLAPADAVRMACDALEISMAPATFQKLAEVFGTAIFAYPPVPIPGALDAVRAAAEQLPIGIISDSGMSPGSSLRRLLDDNGFTPHFTTLTFSDEVGVAKPQAPMFERTAKALNVAPHELLHLGDLEPTDIKGVQALGGMAGLFAGANNRFAKDTRAEHTFYHWHEFVDALPGLL